MKIKKIIAIMASAALTALLPAVNLHADEIDYIISNEDERYMYLVNEDGTISIGENQYSKVGVHGDTILPSQLDGMTVTGICKNGFTGSDITSVTLPESICDIGSLAFANCLTLSQVTLNDNITYMGELVFSNTAYETTLLANAEPNFAVIDDYILYLYTGSQTEIEVPDGIRLIANSAFANNGVNSDKEITTVSCPDGLQYIGDNAFENCGSLTKIILRTGLESVGTNAISSVPSIYGFIGTYAETFAAANGNTFVPLIQAGEYMLECDYEKGFKQYYFSTDTEFSREGLHVYMRYSDGSREEITDWTFDSIPSELYAQANKTE